jgi:CheY-like chemotaxis protein
MVNPTALVPYSSQLTFALVGLHSSTARVIQSYIKELNGEVSLYSTLNDLHNGLIGGHYFDFVFLAQLHSLGIYPRNIYSPEVIAILEELSVKAKNVVLIRPIAAKQQQLVTKCLFSKVLYLTEPLKPTAIRRLIANCLSGNRTLSAKQSPDISKRSASEIKTPPPFTFAKLLQYQTQLFIDKIKNKELAVSIEVDDFLVNKTLYGYISQIGQILFNLICSAIESAPRSGIITLKALALDQELIKKNILYGVVNSTYDAMRSKAATSKPKFSDIEIFTVPSSIHTSAQAFNLMFLACEVRSDIARLEFGETTVYNKSEAEGSPVQQHLHGTDLELFVCKKLLNLLHGELGVKSHDGKVSTSWFVVPIEEVDSSVGPSKESGTLPQQVSLEVIEEPLVIGQSVLVVEDHPVNQRLMALTLKKLGLNAVVVDDGYQAVSMVKNADYRFDLIFMDCRMPGLDGLETTRAIRKYEEEKIGSTQQLNYIPIIALTAAALPGDREKCIEAGMNDYITKPITRQILKNILTKWLPNCNIIIPD